MTVGTDPREYAARMEAALEPCPWCGAKARFMPAPESWVQCSVCIARLGMRSDGELAVDEWNRVAGAIDGKRTPKEAVQ